MVVILDSENHYSRGCRNVSHCKQQQSYSRLCIHLDDRTQPTYEMTPGLKPFSVNLLLLNAATFTHRLFLFVFTFSFVHACMR